MTVFFKKLVKEKIAEQKNNSCFTERASQFTVSLIQRLIFPWELMEDLNLTVLWRSYGDLEVTKV